MNDNRYGKWSHDDLGLPCFDADLESNPVPYYSFPHLIGTGHVCLLTDQWGNANLLTTEGGTTCLSPISIKTRSGLYVVIKVDGKLHSLIFNELNRKKHIRYGIGYARYTGELKTDDLHLKITQLFLAPPDRRKNIIGWFMIENLGEKPIIGKIQICSDILIKPNFNYKKMLSAARPKTGKGFASFTDISEELGDVYIAGGGNWAGSAANTTLILNSNLTIGRNESLSEGFCFGYGKDTDYRLNYLQNQIMEPSKAQKMWKNKLSTVKVETEKEWILDECIWTVGQIYALENYDSSVNEYFVSLGGYAFFSNPNDPDYVGTGAREDAQTAMALAYWNPELAKSSLRFVAKTQLWNGDIPKSHNHRKEKDLENMKFESDNEIWFIMGCCEYVKSTGDISFYDESVDYWDHPGELIWEHMKKAFNWIRERIGVGRHGHIRIETGDWNDYLSNIGSAGKGESVMNTGMACRTFRMLTEYARLRKDEDFVSKAEIFLEGLKSAMASAFDQKWFVRAYMDDGRPIGCRSDGMLYINAQSWAALGGCGTKEQRKTALLNAVKLCHTDIGLTLMNKPYSSPPPSCISLDVLPCGEGENAGIWPQTVYWLVWALAEEGMTDIALEEWQCMSLRNHSDRYPDVPFGIYNGPDCYSSKFAGALEGWSQVQVFNRIVGTPMLPIVAWQAFALKKINEAGKRFAVK